jgi:RNA polymerase-binding transcription factor DksA
VTTDPTTEPLEPTAGETGRVDPAVVEAELDDVARALDRLDEGTYGTCEVCGATLADEVLADAPAARFCAEHQPVVR